MSSTPDQPSPTPDPADPTSTDAETTPQEAAEPATAREPQGQEPQDVTLLVDPAHVRRAPRYPVFLWVGVLVGIVAGLGFATWLVGTTGAAGALMKPGVYVTVVVLATTALSMGVAGLLAVLADRRSLRRR